MVTFAAKEDQVYHPNLVVEDTKEIRKENNKKKNAF